MKEFKGLATVSILAACVAGTTAAHATVMSIDQFVAYKNGTVIYNDTFSDGVPPPSTEATFPGGGAVSTSVIPSNGTSPPIGMTETGGRLLVDGTKGRPNFTQSVLTNTGAVIFTGQELSRFTRVRFITGSNPANTLGLRDDDDISVMGLFDLRVPNVQPDLRTTNWGIGLADFGPGNPNAGDDVLRASVLRGTFSGDQVISYFRSDSSQGPVTQITGFGTAPTDFNNDQILLRLSSPANDNTVTADFAYVNSPLDLTDTASVNALSFQTLGTASAFNGEDFTRGEFRILQRVEELNLGRLTAGSPTSISQQVTIAPGTIQVDVGFNYRFEQASGDLTVMLGTEILGTLMAPNPASGTFSTAFFSLTDTTVINALIGLSPVDLKFIMDGNAGDTILLDSIFVNGLAGFANGDFSNGLASWTPTTSSPAGSVGVLTVQQVPEPATIAIMLVALAAIGAVRRRPQRVAA